MIHLKSLDPYCVDPLNRKRFPTIEVNVGGLIIGGEQPIRLQSMTTVDTMDTLGSVEQSIRMIDAGCELVRLTAPSKKEAENLLNIKNELLKRGYATPLVADIHFTPNAAEIASKIVEKVRVNPGNYADKKKFEEIDYTDQSYAAELLRIEEKFKPLIALCKEYGTAMRIGTNHGSLSDRILSRYGDTPEGMVESAMEFIRICEKNDFYNLVVSMKASNALIMVQAYRLLSATMLKTKRGYPLHLGVTEAGDGEDGRIKSAVGIGALLEDGLGDTIRVSLTEEPEKEIPVAAKLTHKFLARNNDKKIKTNSSALPYSPFSYSKRSTVQIGNIGSKQVPIVVADLSNKTEIKPSNLYGFGYNYSIELDKWTLQEQAADYAFIGDNKINFEKPGSLGLISNFDAWLNYYSDKPGCFPLIHSNKSHECMINTPVFVLIDDESTDAIYSNPRANFIYVLHTAHTNRVAVLREIVIKTAQHFVNQPIILMIDCYSSDNEQFQINVSSEAGTLLIDGIGDGLWIKGNAPSTLINSTAFGILQATRTRISKTEYISCPSCGRTLFDLQETTAKIRKETAHLKGLKIGIMGCIVNGPGEMADADYGYVGTGPGKITLYKEKNVVKKNVQEDQAVQELINLIKENGDWVDLK